MTRIIRIILVTAAVSAAVTSSYVLLKNPPSQTANRADQDQRVRDFFKPLPKQDLHNRQEMRPRW